MNITLSSQLVEQIKRQDQWGELSSLYRGDFSQHPVGRPMSLPLRVVRILAQEKVFDPKDLPPADRVLVDTARQGPQKMGKVRAVVVGKKGGNKKALRVERSRKRFEGLGYVTVPEELRVALRELMYKPGLSVFAKRHSLVHWRLYLLANGRTKFIRPEDLRAIEGALRAGPDSPFPLPGEKNAKKYAGYEEVPKELREMLTELQRHMPLVEFSRRCGLHHDRIYRIQNGRQKTITPAVLTKILNVAYALSGGNSAESPSPAEPDAPIPFRVAAPTPSVEPSPQAGFTLESLFERFVEQSEKLQAAIQANQELLKEHAATLNRACDALVQAIPAQNRA